MSYKKICRQDIDFLKQALSDDRVYAGEDINEDYCHDEMQEYGLFSPEAVVEPVCTYEVSAVMKYAFQNNIPVTPRGSGTGLCGGAVPICGGIVLSLAKMNRILEFDHENLTVTVEPGVLLMELAKAASEQDYLYPPDPGEKSATIGGNVMTNAGGMRAVKYGVIRDYVRAIEAVLPNGEVTVFGCNVSKNSSGYSLKDLLIGSEGTLAVITKLVLKLVPAPERTLSLLVPFHTLEDCIDTVPKIIQAKVISTAIEFMQREVIEAAEQYLGKKFPGKTSDAYLLITVDGGKNEVERLHCKIADICLENGAIDVFISDTEERQESIWSARGAFLEAIKSSTTEMDECDVVVPRNKIALFVRFVSGLEKSYGVRIRSFGHAGDGNLHVYVCRDSLPKNSWREKLNTVMDAMYMKAKELGGQVSGEHGIGHAKIGYLCESIGDLNMALIKGIKEVFDPKRILNPGKVIE